MERSSERQTVKSHENEIEPTSGWPMLVAGPLCT